MKNLVCFLTVVIPCLVIAQPCESLFFSEFIFGKPITENGNSDTNKNHSLEVYNPSKETVDLEEYSITLLGEGLPPVEIDLNGVVLPHEPVVISNLDADDIIKSKSDILTSFLEYTDKTMVLLKKNGQLVDKLGNEGEGISIFDIDLERLDTDSSYLASLIINLETLEGISIRRNSRFNQGTVEFVNHDFINEWALYQSWELTNLGLHLSSCADPVLYWVQDVFVPEEEIIESDESWHSATLCVAGEVSDWFSFTNDPDVGHIFDSPMVEEAMEDEYEGFTDGVTEVIWAVNFPECITVHEAVRSINDFEVDNWDGMGNAISIEDANGTGITVDPESRVWDALFWDPLNNVKPSKLSESIKIYPTFVTGQSLTIELSDPLDLQKIEIYSGNGGLISVHDPSYSNTSFEIKLPVGLTRGFYFLSLETEGNIVLKKFFKL